MGSEMCIRDSGGATPCCGAVLARLRLLWRGRGARSGRERLLEMGDELVADQRLKARLHVGPLELSCDGVQLKPKLNFGVQGPAIYAVVGLRDVRGASIAAEAFAMVYVGVQSEGDSIGSFLENARSADALPLLGVLLALLPRVLGAVLDATGIDIEAASHRVSGLVVLYAGLGVTAGLNLGCWPDADGYYAVGVEGTVASGVGIGVTIRVGVHRHGRAMRVTLFAGNVGFDVVCALKHVVAAHGSELTAAAESAPASEGASLLRSPGLSRHFSGWWRLSRSRSTLVRASSTLADAPEAALCGSDSGLAHEGDEGDGALATPTPTGGPT